MTTEHEEEDDDLYGPSETPAAATKQELHDNGTDGEDDQPMDEGLESGDDESDSDSVRSQRVSTRRKKETLSNTPQDLEIIIDKPDTAAQPVSYVPACHTYPPFIFPQLH